MFSNGLVDPNSIDPFALLSEYIILEFDMAKYIMSILNWTGLWYFFAQFFKIWHLMRKYYFKSPLQAEPKLKPMVKYQRKPRIRYHRVPGPWRRQQLPPLPERAYQIPCDIPDGPVYYVIKGLFVAHGRTAFIDKLESGYVAKYPKPNPYNPQEAIAHRRDMQTEADAYHRIGNSPYIPKLIQWDTQSCCLILEHLENGSLESYLQKRATENPSVYAPHTQREKWALQAAEALAVVHEANVIHCDVTPRNFLLNAKLDLLIADFAGSSVAGSTPSVTTSPRFQPPDFGWERKPGKSDDIFALGSILYFIMTEEEPYADLGEDQVQRLFKEGKFPDVSKLTCGNIIQGCWERLFESACPVAVALRVLYAGGSREDTMEILGFATKGLQKPTMA